jgi:hypothetical protein
MMVALLGSITNLNMDLDTARHHVERIKEHLIRGDYHLNQARKLILDLKNLQGWQVLGYKSWRECVMAEFNQSSSSVYRQLNAAMVELELSPSGGIGDINERVLRPLTKRNFDTEARQAIWAISQEIVSEGGKVTSGIVEAVVEGFKDMLASGAIQDADGNQHPISEQMHADLVARVREVKLKQKDHLRRMSVNREYILGGVQTDKIEAVSGGTMGKHWAKTLIEVDSMQRDKLLAAIRSGKPVYASLWIED